MSHFDYLKSIHSNLKRLTVLLTIGYTPEAAQTVKDIVSNTISNAPDNIRLDIEGYYPGLSQEHFRTTVKKILVKLVTMQMQSAAEQLKGWHAYQQFNNVANYCNDLRIPHDMLVKIERLKDAGMKIKELPPAITTLIYNQMGMELNRMVPGDVLANMTLFSGLAAWCRWKDYRTISMLESTLNEMLERVSFINGMLLDTTKIPHNMLHRTQFQNIIAITRGAVTRVISLPQLYNTITTAESIISDENNLSLVQKLLYSDSAADKQVLSAIDMTCLYGGDDIKTLLNNTLWCDDDTRKPNAVSVLHDVNGWLDKIYAKTDRLLECDSGIMGKLSAELITAATKDNISLYNSLVKLYAIYIHNIEDYHNAIHIIQRLGRIEMGTSIMAINALSSIILTAIYKYTKDGSTVEPMTYHATMTQEGFFDMFKKKKDHEASGDSIELDNISELTDEMLTPEHRIQIRANRESFKGLYYTWAVCIGHVNTNLTKSALFGFIDSIAKLSGSVYVLMDSILKLVKNVNPININTNTFNKSDGNGIESKPTTFRINNGTNVEYSAGYIDVFKRMFKEHALPVSNYLNKRPPDNVFPIYPLVSDRVATVEIHSGRFNKPDISYLTLEYDAEILKLPDGELVFPILTKQEVIELYKKIVAVGKKMSVEFGKLEDAYHDRPNGVDHITDIVFPAVTNDEKHGGMLFQLGEFLESLFHVYAKDVYTDELYGALNTGILDK